jgi:hypothetical protein
MIYVATIFYNDGPELLERAFKSFKACGAQIIAIDGAYEEFPKYNGKVYSTDGCIDVAKKYATINVAAKFGGWQDQAEKRTQLFRVLSPGESVIVVDADEIMKPCTLPNEAPMDIGLIGVNTQGGSMAKYLSVRVFKVYEDLVYLYQHCRVYRLNEHFPEQSIESGVKVSSHLPENLMRPKLLDTEGKVVEVDHFINFRPDERKQKKEQYYRMRKESMLANAKRKGIR